MAEKKKGRKRKEEYIPPNSEEVEKPTKDEYSIARWLRKNVPTKRTKFLNHNVEYFTAYKAVDALMESHWSKPAKENEIPFFTSRAKIIEYLDIMLRHKFYHRAKKIPVTEQELKARKKGDKKKEDPDEKKKEESKSSETEKQKSNDEKGEATTGTEKKKRKVRLEMHLEQYFEDGLDAYVWIYDPVPVYYWFFGTLLVLGAIGVCLFPLWPPSVRQGVYYLSLAAIGFLISIIGLAVLRLIVFCIVWMLTLGKHHIWLLPNLTQDVGFFASFWPLYHYEYKGTDGDGKKDLKKKKKKKDKDSDGEDDTGSQKENVINESETKTAPSPIEEDRNSESEALRTENSTPENRRISESESESSQRSSTGRDFEMVDKDDLESSA